MNYNELINKYFKNNKVKKCFLNQVDLYNKIKETIIIHNKYNIGDKVVLNKGTLLHGTRISVDNLFKIKEKGILAVEFYDKKYPNQKNHILLNFGILKKIYYSTITY